MSVLERIRKLYPFHYSVVSEGNDASVPLWREELDFKVHEFPSGSDLNGWIAGPQWRVRKAELRHDGRLIYDGKAHPLGVITGSSSFEGTVELAELREHLFHSDEDPDAIVYHWTMLYRAGESNWGFCVPRRLVEALQPGPYQVVIETERQPGTMKVLDYLLPGRSQRTVLLNGHCCHPFQANDDLSGCCVGIEIIKRLARLPERRLSYRLVVAPELIGTAHWLDRIGAEAQSFTAGIMLKSVGNPGPLKLQHSFTGEAEIDRAARHVFGRRYGADYISGAFRTIHGNDETVFEAPGYEIPSISVTRFPFFGYHTSLDTPERLSHEHLDDAVETVLGICMALEHNIRLERLFKGLVCLSQPKYQLYRAAPAPGIDREAVTRKGQDWNVLMNGLPRHLDGRTDLLAVAERYDVPLDELHAYCMQWVERGLARVVAD